jgi:hypothetical protein
MHHVLNTYPSANINRVYHPPCEPHRAVAGHDQVQCLITRSP